VTFRTETGQREDLPTRDNQVFVRALQGPSPDAQTWGESGASFA
jgi:hypothetical protein